MPDPHASLAPLRGLVLAGGQSSRLGRDKAALVLGGETLLARAVALLGRFVPDVRVSIRPEQAVDDVRARFILLPDESPGIGPAAGLLAAHRLFPDSAWLVLACDMPEVSAAMIAMLVAARGGGGVAFRGADKRPEPLCAIYEPATLARFRQQVAAGGNASPRDWLARADCVLLDAPDPRALVSVNTPADLDGLTGGARTRR